MATLTQEIHDLHQALQDWFNGTCAEDPAWFQQHLAGRLDDAFRRTSPEGERSDREQLLAELVGVHGANPAFRLRIERLRVVALSGDLAVVDFDELQLDAEDPDGDSLGLACTAVLQADPRAVGGWRWLHLHETWLPEEG